MRIMQIKPEIGYGKCWQYVGMTGTSFRKKCNGKCKFKLSGYSWHMK